LNFRVDFYCPSGKLVIELDGPIHERQAEDDAERQQYLERFGYRFQRFTNDEVVDGVQTVLMKIRQALDRPEK